MNYKTLLPAFFLLYTINAHAQNDISLNGKWQFQTDSANNGESQRWYAVDRPDFGDELTVPGNWNTENRYAGYTGKAWYKKTILIPSSLKGKLIRLNFEGVFNLAKVWVNGQFVIENNLGYLQFEKDISGLLKYGETNTIVVSADNHFKVGALWNWGGIRRPVKLLVNNPIYIGQNHVTPQINLDNRIAKLNFEIPIINSSRQDAEVSGMVEVSREGHALKTVPFNANVKANQSVKQSLETRLNPDQVWLWNLDDPNLYDYKISLINRKSIVDIFQGHFGLRLLEIDNDEKQLRLNGKVIRPLGFNLVPDDRTTGNTLPLWRIKEDIDLMKSLGAGVARMSHVPYHKELLDYLDEKGMLICEEIPVWGDNNSMVKTNNPVTNEWLRRMIADHYNHPCIFGWSVGNEIGKNKDVMAYTDSAIALVKRLDTTRLGVTVSYTGQNQIDPLQLSDIGFMNSYGRNIGRQAERIHTMHPKSTLFLSEFGWGQLNEDLVSDFPIQSMMDSLRLKPFLIGASLWTFNDYRSTYKDTKEPSQNRPWGLVDVARQKKAAFYSYRRANKPIASFEVNAVKSDPTSGELKIRVDMKPRAIFDLPAYELSNYRVVLKVMDNHGRVTAGDFYMLPNIRPGDSALTVALNVKNMNQIPFKATVSLVSRQNYVLYDTVLFFQKALAPKILFAAKGITQLTGEKTKRSVIQIRYAKDATATGYKVRYHSDGTVKESTLTTASYINIGDTVSGQLSDVELVAVNDAGETTSAIQFSGKLEKLLPPIIRYTEPADGAFFIEMETAPDDNLFIVQTTEQQGNYNNVVTTVSKTKGALKVPAPINGKTYYFRVKHISAGGEESGWSEEHSITPDGGCLPPAPEINGIILKGSDVLLCFEPVKKAIGYDLLYKNEKENTWHHELITSSQIDQYQFKLTQTKGKISVRLAAINAYGTSGYTLNTIVGQ